MPPFEHCRLAYPEIVRESRERERERRERREIFNGSKNTQTHEELGGTLSIFVWGIEKHASERLKCIYRF